MKTNFRLFHHTVEKLPSLLYIKEIQGHVHKKSSQRCIVGVWTIRVEQKNATAI